ncbi:MAG: rhodanese-like domain-containing protein [Deltaproteobacteria bacterium]|nr:rhodanese-like domain-containing protein [Deltaproteobacteria bacterium]
MPSGAGVRNRSGTRVRAAGAADIVVLVVLAALAASASACRAGFAFVVGVDEVSAGELAAQLRGSHPPLVVDVRDPAEFRAGHIDGAILLRQEELAGYFTRLGPARDRPIVVVCSRGFRSVAAAAVVAPLGYADVSSLAGGMAAWRGDGRPTVTTAPPAFPAGSLATPRLPLNAFQEFMEFAAGFLVKPGYMLLSLLLAFLLRRKRDTDLVLIRWSLLSFFAGETACYVNILVTHGLSDGLELAHGIGMIGQNVLLPWGLFLFLDRRALRLSSDEGACALQRLCGRCWKRDDVSCALQRLFLFLIFGIGAFALLPLSAPLRPARVILPVYGTDWPHDLSLLVAFVQFRLYPALALLCFVAALVLLLHGRAGTRRAQIPFFLGLGLLSFPLFRWFLEEGYRDMPVWAEWWEEATEFLAILGTGVLLFVFRRQLGLFGRVAPEGPEARDAHGTG